MKIKISQNTIRILLYVLIFIILLLIIISLIYLLFFYIKTCADKECYFSSLRECKRAYFIKEDSKATWSYKIIGNIKGDKCSIDVKLSRMKQGNVDLGILEGKTMKCQIPKNSGDYPEKDIILCTGELKEEMQEIIIKKMHNYILEHLGEIKEEFI